jgi:hypothetical protein
MHLEISLYHAVSPWFIYRKTSPVAYRLFLPSRFYLCVHTSKLIN